MVITVTTRLKDDAPTSPYGEQPATSKTRKVVNVSKAKSGASEAPPPFISDANKIIQGQKSEASPSYIQDAQKIIEQQQKAAKKTQRIVRVNNKSFTGGTGTISRATEEESKAIKRNQTFWGRLVNAFIDPEYGAQEAQRTDKNQVAETLGLTGRVVGEAFIMGAGSDIVLAGKTPYSFAPKVAAETPETMLNLKKAYDLTQKSKIARTLTRTGTTTARALAIEQGAELAGKGLSKNKDILQDPNYKAALQTAYNAEQQALKSDLWHKQLAAQISVGFSSQQDTWAKSFEQELRNRGYSDEQAYQYLLEAQRQRKWKVGGESAALLNIARESEAFGRKEVAKAFTSAAGTKIPENAAFGQIFKKTFGSIGRAGLTEGVASQVMQTKTREQPQDVKSVVVAGLAGFGSAGLIGGTIAGSRVTRPTISKSIEFLSYITDPYEKAGDIAQDVTENVFTRFGGKVITPVIIAPSKPTITLGTAPKKTKSNNNILNFVFGTETKGGKTPTGKIPSKAPVNPFAFTPADTKGQVPIMPDIPIQPNTNVPTDTNTNIFSNMWSPTNTPVNTPVNVPVNTPVNVPININIPTVTPMLRIPPPIPLSFGSSGSGRGTRKGKKTKIFNELENNRRLLKKLIGF